MCFLFLCLIGAGLSVYAYHVETTKEKDNSYRAACDINEQMSCSKVFTSRYGRGFGILEHVVGKKSPLNQPNSVFGLVFYALQTILGLQRTSSAAFMQVILAVMANMGSVYLAYILYFVLNDVCVVCVSTYVVNFLLLLTCINKYSILKNQVSIKKKV
ncbi:hypothetical protein CAPTEDRAFT_131213 [Capitella teleta]|uniref:vitamin-K-epoxide reductase (warfarin-sensitive) n=1 Tax=Capitella teleta TaxID=283909 RepID=R7T430_CAPTE|nr:hypothetical protein CAPTEDRAFT_161296 [Capitella teleta]ELU07291.1 hypothetical protein CAPTEDRAFT_131213 [Capitella teleta]|eukprot:ELT87583.1 hypothetical protein CAPTEDRAFT_161296 [Capitella teleta]